jgi:two-component system, OmpR family, sensor histidine kinase BaeS
MRRLVVRLSLSMVAVALTILTLVVLLESLAFVREYRQLPRVVRQPLFSNGQEVEDQRFLDQLPEEVREAYINRVEQFQNAFRDFRIARRRSIFVSALITLLLGTLLAVVLARRIARPLAAVSKAANEMKQGRLSARVDATILETADEETLALSQSFNAMAETLEKNELERKHMIADIAHELRTPLAVMQARLAAMQDEVVPLNATELEKVYRQTELLSRLVADLRTLSLAEAGRLSLNLQRIDLKTLFENLIANVESTAKTRKVEIALEAKEAAFVHADSDRLIQVFSNLLENALRYTPAHKTIGVKLLTNGLNVTVEIHDAGPGFSKKALEKVFDRFYKGDERSGSGLGLAIVKSLIELQGGSVTVRNGLEGGAICQVVLPKA